MLELTNDHNQNQKPPRRHPAGDTAGKWAECDDNEKRSYFKMKDKNEKLTQTQKSYAKKRIQDIRSDCMQVIRRSMSRKVITFGDVYKQIKSKKPHMPKSPELTAYQSIALNEFFDFKHGFETREDFEKRVDSKIAEMTIESNRIIDEIMLGDATNAIKKISDFEKKWSKL